MEENLSYVSLYEFLGRPAGGDLGKQVYTHAKKIGVKTQTRDIANPIYNGKVMLYPIGFLTDYFTSIPTEDSFPTEEEWGNTRGCFENEDDLPF
jgi:hypothetical protein